MQAWNCTHTLRWNYLWKMSCGAISPSCFCNLDRHVIRVEEAGGQHATKRFDGCLIHQKICCLQAANVFKFSLKLFHKNICCPGRSCERILTVNPRFAIEHSKQGARHKSISSSSMSSWTARSPGVVQGTYNHMQTVNTRGSHNPARHEEYQGKENNYLQRVIPVP